MSIKARLAPPPKVIPINAAQPPINHARLGRIVGIDTDGAPLVEVPENHQGPQRALLATPIDQTRLQNAAANKQVAVLLFEDGDPARPILVGLQMPLPSPGSASAFATLVQVDGQEVRVEAQEKLHLGCGKASITLFKNGKVAIHGTFVESHAQGTNRIKGAVVKVN
jgi:hypothetical protein